MHCKSIYLRSSNKGTASHHLRYMQVAISEKGLCSQPRYKYRTLKFPFVTLAQKLFMTKKNNNCRPSPPFIYHSHLSIPYAPYSPIPLSPSSLPSTLLTLLQDLFHNLLLFNQKRPHHSILDAITAPRTSVCALNGFFRARDFGVFSWAEGGDLF